MTTKKYNFENMSAAALAQALNEIRRALDRARKAQKKAEDAKEVAESQRHAAGVEVLGKLKLECQSFLRTQTKTRGG